MTRSFAFLISLLMPVSALAHSCDADARQKAKALLELHFGGKDGENGMSIGIDDEVKTLAPMKALKGEGK